MKKWWNQSSPFTRAVLVAVLATCVGMTYVKQRAQPLRDRLDDNADEIEELRDDLDEALLQVERLRTESRAAERWAGYAQILDRQTTGRSFHDILDQCGGPRAPGLEVRNVEFQRVPPTRGFPAVGVRFQVQGRFADVLQFLHRLDDAFPPVELSTSRFTLAEPDGPTERANSHVVMAQMEGILHEPQ